MKRDVAVGAGRPAPDDGDAAELAAEVERAAHEVLSGKSPAPVVPPRAWDRKTEPKHLARIVEHIGLTAAERELLRKNGFVVLSRASARSYGVMMHAIHRQELPLYVSADAILHAVFRGHEAMLAAAEMEAEALVTEVLDKMEASLTKDASAYAPAVARDARVYLGVARALLGSTSEVADGVTDPEIRALAAKAIEAKGIEVVSLFGRPRFVDWTFYTPRGPYARGLQSYFRAMVWLTRLELNVASRGARSSAPQLTPEETPREATLALVLADLARRAGVSGDIDKLDRYQRVLAGPREDVPLSEIAKLGAGAPLGDPDAAAAQLRSALGSRFQRTVNYQVRPYVAPALPAIATFFGVGITEDAPAVAALSSKLAPRVVRGPDVAFALGVDRARAYVDPTGRPLLDGSRAALGGGAARTDLHAAWLGAVRGLAEKASGATPSYMKTAAWEDSRVSSMMTAYGQIRHAYALHGVQVYDEGGCEIPDAYVEPSIAVYDGILRYADRLRALKDVSPGASAWADRLARHVGALRAIAQDELAGRALTGAQLRYLRMVAEYERPGRYASRNPGRQNGWYPALYVSALDAFEPASFIADYFTSAVHGKISYLGGGDPRLGVFVVDVGGEARAMVGPVTRTMEAVHGLGARLDDYESPTPWVDEKTTPAWERSYVAPSVAAPPIEVSSSIDEATVTARKPLDEITVEAVDEHGETLARAVVRPKVNESTSVPLSLVGGRGGEHRGTRVRLRNGAVFEASVLGLFDE